MLHPMQLPHEASSNPLESHLKAKLEVRRQAHFPVIDLSDAVPDATSGDLFSNDYLSLASSRKLRSMFLERLTSTPHILGACGSRVLDGNTPEHVALEQRLKAFYNMPALIVNSGYDANCAIFGALPQSGDAIVYDEYIHASVFDGMRSSRASSALFPFEHNSVSNLRAVLERLVHELPGLKEGKSSVFIATESVFSMDGDCAPLRSIVETVELVIPQGCGHIVVDEAHSTGIYGKDGRGMVSQLGLEERVSIRLHTFGKALATTGAVILSSPVIRSYLINYARPIIFSTALTRAAVLSIQASFDMLENGTLHQRTTQLFVIVKYMLSQLVQTLRFVDPAVLRLLPSSAQHSEKTLSPIVPLLTAYPVSLASYLIRHGYHANPIISPAVPRGTERIRIVLHAKNSVEQVDRFVTCLMTWVGTRAWESGQTESRLARL